MSSLNIDQYLEYKSPPKISIIIAAYKAGNWIENCIESVLSQHLNSGWEMEVLLGVDGCDETAAAARMMNDSRLRKFWFRKNIGTYRVFNSLSTAAKGNLLARFDADDVMLQDYLGSQLEVFARSPDVSITRTWSIYTDAELNPAAAELARGRTSADGKRREGSDGQFMMNQHVWQRLGGFQPWRCFADSEFLVRARFAGFKIEEVPRFLYHRRVHAESLTQAADSGYSSKLRRKYRKIVRRNRRAYTEGKLPPKLTAKPAKFESF